MSDNGIIVTMLIVLIPFTLWLKRAFDGSNTDDSKKSNNFEE